MKRHRRNQISITVLLEPRAVNVNIIIHTGSKKQLVIHRKLQISNFRIQSKQTFFILIEIWAQIPNDNRLIRRRGNQIIGISLSENQSVY